MSRLASSALVALLLFGCAHGRNPYAATESSLELDRVVLYRNGIGYFERRGEVKGDALVIKVRKDQVNDLLKSLTVIDRKSGQAVSVSMPLDPESWANAALSTLAPGQGSLAQVLDALRGTYVTLKTTQGKLRGRIVLVEAIVDEPDPTPPPSSERVPPPQGGARDYKVSLMDGKQLQVARLSKVRGVTLQDGDLALQFHRTLDATAGEGMFQQVAVEIRLAGASSHDLVVSYVVAAPMWKPTYRVVLPEPGEKGPALLQAWAVVDNTSGEDWGEVSMSLTSGAPIAFRYDLHTPRTVSRSDLTEAGVQKRAAVAMGETSYQSGGDRDSDAIPDSLDKCPDSPETFNGYTDEDGCPDAAGVVGGYAAGQAAPAPPPAPVTTEPEKKPARRPMQKPASAPKGAASANRSYDFDDANYGGGETAKAEEAAEAPPALDLESLRRSTQASARAKSVSGLTRFDLNARVTVPDGSSTMVAIVNQDVAAEQTFLFRPGGAGSGYEQNPYRVVRFKNTTPFVLEPGPIAIYAGGSFVGEGLSEAVGTQTSTTIPFAVEPSLMVSSQAQYTGEDLRILKIVRGVIEVENFQRVATTWTVKGQPDPKGYSVLIRHPKQGGAYALKSKIDGLEELPDAYLVPVKVTGNATEGKVEVVEQTPSHATITIWDGRVPQLLDALLRLPNLDAGARKKIEPLVRLRQEIGRIDTEIEGLARQQAELDQRASETRQNLEAIKKDSAAGDLRGKLNKRLDEFTRDADKLGRSIVELQSKRLEKKIELEDSLQTIDLSAPTP
ncbi:protein of unknown function [Nannocystis exedens]|uniref:Uncharacterized protein n=1 Tax=Nannocystis exedens TaxID=54 RepID=A0A1I1VJP4_9BACT|nr:DUF4139 domain-containing protein [Nannocystis exedens]PCC72588.1 hypothetical protein NAEX_05669 [Nannocystis exedens]SFD83079.1 protein of unknown function [Nannocystis exedens]